jgi:photosystem II stability/assembly factor-like uncharacterized protein
MHWTWQETQTWKYLASVDFVDTQNGWAVGEDGTILHTEDGGESWESQHSGTRENLSKVKFVDTLRGWASALGNTGSVLRTKNGGKTWLTSYVKFSPLQTGASINSVFFLNANEGWACGVYGVGNDTFGGIAHTTDGGKSWKPQYFNEIVLQQFYAIGFKDKLNGWAAKDKGWMFGTTPDLINAAVTGNFVSTRRQ